MYTKEQFLKVLKIMDELDLNLDKTRAADTYDYINFLGIILDKTFSDIRKISSDFSSYYSNGNIYKNGWWDEYYILELSKHFESMIKFMKKFSFQEVYAHPDYKNYGPIFTVLVLENKFNNRDEWKKNPETCFGALYKEHIKKFELFVKEKQDVISSLKKLRKTGEFKAFKQITEDNKMLSLTTDLKIFESKNLSLSNALKNSEAKITTLECKVKELYQEKLKIITLEKEISELKLSVSHNPQDNIYEKIEKVNVSTQTGEAVLSLDEILNQEFESLQKDKSPGSCGRHKSSALEIAMDLSAKEDKMAGTFLALANSWNKKYNDSLNKEALNKINNISDGTKSCTKH